ncbi:MAG: hypothetical protein QW728_02660 [Thermoplasmata archaeon]
MCYILRKKCPRYYADLRFKFNYRGQSAVYDAIIFFILIIIASGVALLFASLASSDQDTGKKSFNLAFAEDFLDCLLQSTVNYTFYEKKSGGFVNLTDKFVNELIVEDVNARYNDLAVPSSLKNLNASIQQIGDGMAVPQFRWCLHYTYSEDGGKTTPVKVLILSSYVQAPADQHFGSTAVIKNTSPLTGDITATVWLWEA